MWIGIPYTKYGFNVSLRYVSRKVIFCFLATLLYALLSLPETNKLIGSQIYLSKFDDIDSNDRYYLLIIHSIIYGLLIYILLISYNPYQKKILTNV